MAAEPVLVMLTDDHVIVRRLRRLAGEHGLAVRDAADADGAEGSAAGGALAGEGGQPAVAVVDLLRPGAVDLVRSWRSGWPEALIAGYLGAPDRELWIAAQRAGCDLVINTGALIPQLRGRLAGLSGQRGRRFPLFDVADAAGRLGLVFASDDTPVGPLAVYQVAGGLYAIADRCPHAGAALSGGEVESGVVTCPGHGSRFDVRTGERVRGPADAGVSCYWLVRDGGQVFLLA